ncbi:hypothetical protein HPB50_018414 [Hyalomma asiaticum]|uniref:Uncharacterized protein n=1 Tax=Hyalomma asiaticum TaxID=266040 RepID=A0ACB7T8N5_HYAAI|nr:hypothetical protein HPB50_018414 [Hyalomma asiaticum]
MQWRACAEPPPYKELRLSDASRRLLSFIAGLQNESCRNSTWQVVAVTSAQHRHFGSMSSHIRSWHMALTANKMLQEVSLYLFRLRNGRPFFTMLASNAPLQTTNIWEFERVAVPEIYRAMQEAGVQERFFVGTDEVAEDALVTAMQRGETSTVKIETTLSDGCHSLLEALCLASSCSHVTSISIIVSETLFKSTMASLVARLVASAGALKKLELLLTRCKGASKVWAEDELVEAVCANKNIRRLHVKGLHFTYAATCMLVDNVLSSRTLVQLIMRPRVYAFELVYKISRGISSNYTLLAMQVPKHLKREGFLWSPIANVVRRNSTLVTRAALFVLGTRSKCNAEAVELVHFNPALLEKVQELASVSESEAMSLINGSLKSFTLLDDFMCLAGVVKRTVTCHSEDDASERGPQGLPRGRFWTRQARSSVKRRHFGSMSSHIRPWHMALTANKALEELNLRLYLFRVRYGRPFFTVLASKAPLQYLNVRHFECVTVPEIYRAMQEAGVQERFFVGKRKVAEIVTAMQRGETSTFMIQTTMLDGCHSFLEALCLPSSCSHVTSLTIIASEKLFKSTMAPLVARLVASASALKKLELLLTIYKWGSVVWAEQALVEAVCANKNIRRLYVKGLHFNETATRMLADIVLSSRTLVELTLRRRTYGLGLLKMISPRISSNYTLLAMQVPKQWKRGGVQWAPIADVVSRNSTLVTRAALFVLGTRSKCNAEAVELVHFNPALLEKVQRLAYVSESEAMSLINDSLKSFSLLDDFMCLVGVVKHTVECHSGDDGEKQLSDLDDDCWLRIRHYLNLSDILDEP